MSIVFIDLKREVVVFVFCCWFCCFVDIGRNDDYRFLYFVFIKMSFLTTVKISCTPTCL